MIEDTKLQETFDFLEEQQKKLIELIDFKKEHITDIEWDDIDYSDAPDFCDAHIVSAKYYDIWLDQALIDKLNEDRDLVYVLLMDYLY